MAGVLMCTSVGEHDFNLDCSWNHFPLSLFFTLLNSSPWSEYCGLLRALTIFTCIEMIVHCKYVNDTRCQSDENLFIVLYLWWGGGILLLFFWRGEMKKIMWHKRVTPQKGGGSRCEIFIEFNRAGCPSSSKTNI